MAQGWIGDNQSNHKQTNRAIRRRSALIRSLLVHQARGSGLLCGGNSPRFAALNDCQEAYGYHIVRMIGRGDWKRFVPTDNLGWSSPVARRRVPAPGGAGATHPDSSAVGPGTRRCRRVIPRGFPEVPAARAAGFILGPCLGEDESRSCLRRWVQPVSRHR